MRKKEGGPHATFVLLEQFSRKRKGSLYISAVEFTSFHRRGNSTTTGVGGLPGRFAPACGDDEHKNWR
jgi:hypothetical protein